jgi:hypothetical protein
MSAGSCLPRGVAGRAPAAASTGGGTDPVARHAERGPATLQIRHNTIYYDGAGFARQIGMLPSQGSLADRMLVSIFNAKSRLARPRR